MKVCLLLLQLATPVHDIYAADCCGGRDCHPVPCEEVTAVGDGWMWRGVTFEHHTLRVAPDGNCHVCINPNLAGPGIPHATCIYLPPRT